jgi:membrane protein YqaA with SNARE-associated domain
MKLLRKLYDWVLSWCESPYAVWALFVLAFTESSFFPIPPDVLLIALVMGNPSRAFYYAGVCTIASALGGAFGYWIGYALMDTVGYKILDFYNARGLFHEVEALYQKYDFWVVFSAAFTPIPYKVFTLASGVFHIDLLGFTLASIVGRGLRFFLVSGLLWYFGESIKVFIDKYFNLLTVIFLLLLIGGFGMIGLL